MSPTRPRTALLAATFAVGLVLGPVALITPAYASSIPVAASGDPTPVDPSASPEGQAEAIDPDEAVTWGVVPATEDGLADKRVSLRYRLDPGEKVSDQVLVTNQTTRAITFEVAAADGVVSADGVFDVLPPDVPSTDVGSWVDIQDTVEVPAEGSVVVPFTLTVPEKATPGDHPGGIVVVLTQQSQEEGGPQVGVTTRVGARIHLRVSGDIEPVVTFSDVATRYEASLNPFAPGSLHVTYTVTNDGNVRLGSIQQFETAGLFGIPTGAQGPSGTVVGQQREILPGQQSTVTAVLTGVWPAGQLTTTLVANQESVGDDPRFASVPAAELDVTTWAVPWPQLVLLVLIVLFVVVWLRRRKRRGAELERVLAEARAAGARDATAAAEPVRVTDEVSNDTRGR